MYGKQNREYGPSSLHDSDDYMPAGQIDFAIGLLAWAFTNTFAGIRYLTPLVAGLTGAAAATLLFAWLIPSVRKWRAPSWFRTQRKANADGLEEAVVPKRSAFISSASPPFTCV
jgi:hypothetical protein